MKTLKTIGKKLLYPPVWLMLTLAVISAALLTAVFLRDLVNSPISYIVYVLSFYSLSVLTFYGVTIFPSRIQKIKYKIQNTKYGGRYFSDITFKTHLSLYRSLAINLLYVGINLISGILYRSVWFAILAGYYTILAVMRFLLLRFVNRNGFGKKRILEFRRTRLCGIILMTLNLTLSGAVLMILYQNRGYEYHGILIYVMAIYTFYITVHSITDIFKYRKYNSPILLAAKVVNFSAALVSMLSLETAMLSQFGADSSPEFRKIMVAATGAGVSVLVIVMALFMIIRSTREIKKLQTDSL